jgi:hypothetical protein
MLVTLHDCDGDCFHINTDHVVMVTEFKELDDRGLPTIPTGKYIVAFDGGVPPLLFPERAIANLIEAMSGNSKPQINSSAFGRN